MYNTVATPHGVCYIYIYIYIYIYNHRRQTSGRPVVVLITYCGIVLIFNPFV